MRLIVFNLANMGPNDIEAVNPEHVVSIRRVTDNQTQVFTSDGNNITVMARFYDAMALFEEVRENQLTGN